MTINWWGHACFQIETEEGSVVLDPYAPGSVPGLKLPKLTADRVICSHGHRDHAWEKGVRLSGRTPGYRLETIPCWHDDVQGALRGENRITVLEAEGLRLAHLGDLGHMLSAAQLAALGAVDVLLIPVGGHYTIGPETAHALKEALRPGLTIPMHYRGKGFGYDVIGPVEDFLALEETVRRIDSNSLDPRSLAWPAVAVLRCPVK